MIETITFLRDLQAIDSRLDAIYELRGSLPEQIDELNATIAELQEKRDRFKNRFDELDSEIKTLSSEVESNEIELKKDEESIFDVTNNKEYDALTTQINGRKEKIDTNAARIEEQSEKRDKVSERFNQYETELSGQKEKSETLSANLKQKIEETDKEEKKLKKERKKVEANLTNQQKRYYTNIRSTKPLAVAVMKRNSCSGCNSIIPLQKQAEIRNHKKLINCETCGRILISELLETVENK